LPRVGDVEAARLLVAAGADVNDADARGVSAVTLVAHSGFSDLAELYQGLDPNAMRAGLRRRTKRSCGATRKSSRTARARADANAPLQMTPTRRSSDDFNFTSELVGATPFWLAASTT
jgi:ankyrin repeat protein